MASPGTCPPLAGRHILLGITGSIAAYKAAVLCRLLKTAGADVRVVMTPLAKQFITPLTMATLSKNPILVEFFDPENGAWNSHVSLGEWADCYLIAPATANTLAKMASGIADNLLLTTYLSARCPVAVAPAMDLDMYAHEATQQNLRTLARRGVHIVEPGEGELASGLQGKGRMAEPDAIAAFVGGLLREKKKSLQGKRLIVTAGATIEAIDPVRFISNHSSGKMGYAIARAARNRGAAVTLLSGPVELAPPVGVEVVNITTTRDLYEAALRRAPEADVVIQAAAPADFRPAQYAQSKIKKSGEGMRLDLAANPDVARALGEAKREGQILVAFAAETNDLRENARGKLLRKNADLIVANDVTVPGAGFGTDTNCALLITRAGETEVPLCAKGELAERILDCVKELRHG